MRNYANLCGPKAAAVGIVAMVLLVAAFDQPEPEIQRRDSLSAVTSGSKPLGFRECAALLALPRESIMAVYNVSSWAPGGWPYWKTVCNYRQPTSPAKVAS